MPYCSSLIYHAPFFSELAQVEAKGQDNALLPWALGMIHSSANFALA